LRKLVCFIACAFNRDDVEKAYDRAIAPTLKKHKVIARRVDRIDYNSKIDEKIIELIESCDFIISDLTYARPSVYYESGYAERKAPVIYTARKDHFRQRDNDPEGDRCIHFDLQMKNIIHWSDSDVISFKKKLSRRISIVSRPLLKTFSVEDNKRIKVEQFARLSQSSQLIKIAKPLGNYFNRHGYHFFIDEGVKWHERETYVGADFTKVVGRTLYVLVVSITPRFQKKDLERVRITLFNMPITMRKVTSQHLKLNPQYKVVEVRFLFSLRKDAGNILHDVFPTFDVGYSQKHLLYEEKAGPESKDARKIHLILIDGCPTEVDFIEQAKTHLQVIENV